MILLKTLEISLMGILALQWDILMNYCIGLVVFQI